MVLADEQIATGEVQVSDWIQVQLKQNFLAKPSSQRLINPLHQGASSCDAAAITSVSVKVARKVLAVMQIGQTR